MDFPRIIIGWQEWIALPELRIPAIRAKIDTGAKTSSLHAYHTEYFKKNGKEFVRFQVHPLKRDRKVNCICEALLIDKRIVKSSGGEKEERPVIRTTLNIHGNEWDIELNLTNRDYMGHRMLLGRQALQKHAMICPGSRYVQGKISEAEILDKYRETN